MLAAWLALLAITFQGEPPADAAGTISGVVLNGTHSGEPIAGAEVQLRAGPNGVLETVDSTTTDIHGTFIFRGVPLDPAIVYLAGANRAGVHYPGQRVQLFSGNRTANVQITAFDAVSEPSPLATVEHNFDVEVHDRVMEITEQLVVSNESRVTYVGRSAGDETPFTFQLSIPPNFDRVTFDNEFYGRRFRIIDHRLVTDIPWPPGIAKLKFTYRIPVDQSAGLFRRRLDLPSSNVCVRVRSTDPLPVMCNLPTATADGGNRAVFATGGEQLPAGYTIELQSGNVPIPWMLYARWGSLVAFAALVLVTFWTNRRNRGVKPSPSSDVSPGAELHRRSKARRRAA
jgi:hypothetical protein